MQPPYRFFARFPFRIVSGIPRPCLTSKPRFSFESAYASYSSITAGLVCTGERGTRYRLVRPLGTQIRERGPNVWLAVDDCNADVEYVVKRPSGDDISDGSWSNAISAFKHELEMQRLFANDPMIRTLLDYVPDSEPGGPMMVLDAFTDSLWGARNARSFTTKEIKWIMKGVLLGIFTVHMKGLVYTGECQGMRMTGKKTI